MSDNNRTVQQHGAWSDHKVDLIIGNLLRLGVIIAAVVVIAGGVPYLIANASHPVIFSTFHGQPDELTTVRGIVRGALALHSHAVIQLGILLLIATPIARVALSLVAFAKQRDRTYMVITTIVLAILAWGLSGGGGM